MRWMLLIAFALTVPAFVALVAWWSARVGAGRGERPTAVGRGLGAGSGEAGRPRHA